MEVHSILRKKASMLILDQTELPHKEIFLEINDYRLMIEAIKKLRIRGAPAIGIAAAGGAWLAALEFQNHSDFKDQLSVAVNEIESSRPTAVNLFHACEKIREIIQHTPENNLVFSLFEYLDSLFHYEFDSCNQMAENGYNFIPKSFNKILTHCNTGGLATYGSGTALGVIRRLAQDRSITVFADETRPLLQGARLTMWELKKSKIPAYLITDNMAAHMIKTEKIDCIITGADRICKNGDSANKIGTMNLAILANYFKIPFYIVAPESTIDRKCEHGDLITIEEREAGEVSSLYGQIISPEEINVRNPAFDVSPAHLITAIITEKKVYEYPYQF